MSDWLDLSYLRTGTNRQRQAWEAIQQTGIMALLQPYTPVLAGTIPLCIDRDDSDLDIICECHHLEDFESKARTVFGESQGYAEQRLTINQVLTSVIQFFDAGFCFELFAQPVPVTKQNAYRHMDIEARLLSLGGPDAYREIRRLKQQGIKTEPAFAIYFDIPGEDPYQALLELEPFTDTELRTRLRNIKTS
ncbi:DUF4269 domain-containing protein [Brevibacillus sp. NRS-1366]|uniref:DUF4269 domain-containing protein n=1 Tax=Brevibacillus sp. NRS-1366 TaxID=3233899 RepID=UPI003D229C1D